MVFPSHKCSDLKQHTFIISISMGQESGHGFDALMGPLLRLSFKLAHTFKLQQGCNQGISQSWGLT